MRTLIAALAVCAVVAALPYHVKANIMRSEHGLAGIHKLGMEDGLLCMSDHEHFGESGAWATREEAEKSAIQSWAGFTRLEYGEVWAKFELAAAKDLKCGPAITSRGEGWACEVKARPCRR